MLNALPLLKDPFSGPYPLSLHETGWGYVIRSVRPEHDLARLAVRCVIAVAWIAALGLWLVPGLAFEWKALLSVALLTALYSGLALFRRTRGYEVQVDTARRELRVGVVTVKGDCWIRSSARFDEIGGSVVQKAGCGAASRRLCLRLEPGSDVLPVAAGDEATLLAVHDRLMGDLRPLEERVSSFLLATGRGPSRAQRVFPRLAPDEITA